MAEIVYFLCSLFSLLCAVMLFRSYRRTGVRLLMWSMFCFIGLWMNNTMLFVDFVVLPHIDLSLVRLIPAFSGTLLLVYGMIWDVT